MPDSLNSKQDFIQEMLQYLPQNFDFLEQSGGSYLKSIRHLEGVLRPFWGIAPAFFTGHDLPEFQPYLRELKDLIRKRQLPKITTHNRQIAVELGVVGHILGKYPEQFLALFSDDEQTYLVDWLNEINTIEFPAGNWYGFLLLVNAGLKKAGLTYSQAKIDFALKQLNSFYVGDGWYSDGPGMQRDYYIAWAFQFYGLLYAELFPEETIAQKFRQRAIIFANQFTHWFDTQGRSLPYGRSMTYRFAHVCFWCELIVSGVWQDTDLPLAEIKGFIVRNLQFWDTKPIALPLEHNLSIGYGYNNLLLSEDYNAPGSPAWAFKTFILLELPDDDTFWTVSAASKKITASIPAQTHAGFLINESKQQTTALSIRQYSRNPLLYHAAEKYGKFAYSTYFGFNLTRDIQGIQQFAVDSTLAVALQGTQQYLSRTKIDESIIHNQYGISFWQLWGKVQVITYLIPISAELHVRIHEIQTSEVVDLVEGGFPLANWNRKYNQAEMHKTSAILKNENGFSKILDLLQNRQSDVVTQGPNTNIYSSEKNAIPVLKTSIPAGKVTLACAVYGSPVGNEPVSDVQLVNTDKTFVIKTGTQQLTITKELFSSHF